MRRCQTLLLGIDEKEYGHFQIESQGEGRTACVLSVGSDPWTPARVHKARPEVPNEDALLVIDEGPLTLLAIADAHFGHESSHGLLTQISMLTDPIPDNPLAALELLQRIRPIRSSGKEPNPEHPRSETTLLVAVYDRRHGKVFGYSFGDSSLVVLGPKHPPKLLNNHNSCYPTPDLPSSLDPAFAQEFTHTLEKGGILLAHTDGIDACHYNHPETSIQPTHIQCLWEEHRSPTSFLRALTTLALEGIPPHPGGQDNIAAIATV